MPRLSAALPPPSVSALKQTFRVGAACAVTYAAYKLLGLAQGYWAVFTVLIVMQGSIGGTLGAAIDRMIGTLVGAGLGAVGAWAHDDSVLGTGVALVAATALGSYLAALRPQLRIAPVTASIMMLAMPPGTPIAAFVVDRIVEIMLGGTIGVLAMVLILPARSQAVVRDRAAATLETMRDLATDMAAAIAGGAPAAFVAPLVALRPPLAAIEQALKDADREHASRLSRHAIPPAVPRTLWRIRSDLVLIARALDPPLPEPVRGGPGAPAAALLRRLAEAMAACAAAMRGGRAVERIDLAPERAAIAAALAAFRTSPEGDALGLDVAGHVFGLSFALDELRRDLRDLADRIDEMNGVAASKPPAAD